jgi:hypothetical protein
MWQQLPSCPAACLPSSAVAALHGACQQCLLACPCSREGPATTREGQHVKCRASSCQLACRDSSSVRKGEQCMQRHCAVGAREKQQHASHLAATLNCCWRIPSHPRLAGQHSSSSQHPPVGSSSWHTHFFTRRNCPRRAGCMVPLTSMISTGAVPRRKPTGSGSQGAAHLGRTMEGSTNSGIACNSKLQESAAYGRINDTTDGMWWHGASGVRQNASLTN